MVSKIIKDPSSGVSRESFCKNPTRAQDSPYLSSALTSSVVIINLNSWQQKLHLFMGWGPRTQYEVNAKRSCRSAVSGCDKWIFRENVSFTRREMLLLKPISPSYRNSHFHPHLYMWLLPRLQEGIEWGDYTKVAIRKAEQGKFCEWIDTPKHRARCYPLQK